MPDYIQDKVFNDFEVPSTSDGSYRGRKNIVDKTKEHLDMKFEQELLQVNQRLKASKAKVSIERTGDVIQLRATLPLKPDDVSKNGKNTKQYKVSLGIPANFDGLRTAEEEANELGKLIARKMFVWNDKYLATKAEKKEQITFAEFYEIFEQKYFETRKRTLKSENSFKSYNSTYKSYFLIDRPITSDAIITAIDKGKTDYAKKHIIALARILKNMLTIDVDFSKYKLDLKPKNRDIPDDKTIVECIDNFEKKYNSTLRMSSHLRDSWLMHKMIYALLAIYGLRPREVINNPDLNWLISSENKYNTFKVHESNKTGYREVLPFVPEWIELFDLKNALAVQLMKKKLITCNSARGLTSKVQAISATFRACRIPFQPYDLRHACAIRSHLENVPIKAASDNLGHSVEIHTKVYQHHFGLENRRKAFEQTFDKVDEVDTLKDEIARLRKRVAELELENTRLKLENTI